MDARSETMLSALDLVCDQATRPSSCLIGFALENVRGLMDKGSREVAPHDEIMDFLRGQLEPNSSLWTWSIDSADLGVPQQRVRVYMCGRRVSWFQRPKPSMSPEGMFISGLSMRDILDPDRPSEVPPSEKMMENLALYKALAQKDKDMYHELPTSAICVCDLSRAGGKTRAPVWQYDVAPTLTTSNRHLWCFGLDPSLPSIDRFMTADEMCMLHGFPPSMPDRLNGRSTPGCVNGCRGTRGRFRGCANVITRPNVGRKVGNFEFDRV